jgi:integrase
MAKITAKQVDALPTGKHSIDGGLILNVKGSVRYWYYRGTFDGKRREWKIGSSPDLSLVDARIKAADYRAQIRDGIDPGAVAAKVVEDTIAEATIITFEEVAKKFYDSCKGKIEVVDGEEIWVKKKWTRKKDEQTWWNVLALHALPKLGKIDIKKISIKDVTSTLEPIWRDKAPTASKVQQRIKSVLDYAVANELREYSFDVSIIKKGLGDQDHEVENRVSLSYEDMPTFLTNFRENCGTKYATHLKNKQTVLDAIEFLILTAVRSQCVRFATWSEIDFEKHLWTIPGNHIKGGKEFICPLSDRAIAVLESRERGADDDLIFPGRVQQSLSDATLLVCVKRGGYKITIHGFRATFRTWVEDCTGYTWEQGELAIAHKVGNKTSRAYARGKALAIRARLFQDWADYCNTGHIDPEFLLDFVHEDNVVPLRAVG